MALRDLSNNLSVTQSIAPQAVTANVEGSAADLRGFDSALACVVFGDYTDGTHTPSLEHSVDGVTYTTVPATDLDGAFTAVSSVAGENTVQKIGYNGVQRYLRVLITTQSATTGALLAADIVAGHPRQAPV